MAGTLNCPRQQLRQQCVALCGMGAGLTLIDFDSEAKCSCIGLERMKHFRRRQSGSHSPTIASKNIGYNKKPKIVSRLDAKGSRNQARLRAFPTGHRRA